MHQRAVQSALRLVQRSDTDPSSALTCTNCLLSGLEAANHLRLHPQVQTVAAED